jgi:hypothetical protein
MKLQDRYPYDSAIVGLNNLYIVDYKGYFYINSPCIMATNKTICTGRTYLLVDNHRGTGVNMTDVRLIDVFFYEGVINLIVQEIISQKTFCLNQYIKCPQNPCKWILIDFDFFIEEMNSKIIKSYCEKCPDTKKKSVADNTHKKLNDDLLEFEF